MAAGTENQVDLVMRVQKPLSLPVWLEPAKYLFSFSGRPVRDFDRVIQAFVGAMVGVRRLCFDRLDVAAQLVGGTPRQQKQ